MIGHIYKSGCSVLGSVNYETLGSLAELELAVPSSHVSIPWTAASKDSREMILPCTWVPVSTCTWFWFSSCIRMLRDREKL